MTDDLAKPSLVRQPGAPKLLPQTQQWLDGGQRVVLEGKRVFFRQAGKRGAPAVLFLHGFPTSSFDWKQTVEHLSGSLHCVTLDLPGYGLSDKPVAYSYSLFQQADVVERLVELLGITAINLVSHDVGTSIHTELLARQQSGGLRFRILSSTFLNGSILKGMAKLTEFQRILESPSLIEQAEQMCGEMVPKYVDSLKSLMARPEAVSTTDALVMKDLLLYQHGNERIPQVYSYVRERYVLRRRWIDALRNETGPVQLIWATDDPIATVEMGRELARLVPDATYTELSDVGHFVPIEAPSEVASAIRLFVL